MPIINLLDEHTINQIAAGEVIERPMSVVKELAENAVDAGATAVTVEIKDGGISFLRVTDNGCGIERHQVPTAFLRHATSKITNALDLVTVSSLGFRGEALSSIASVSRVELITRAASEITGTRYIMEDGKEISNEEIGAPAGTTFIVRDLFGHVPARRKFLKSPQTEATAIVSYMERMALSHPDISFRLIVNGQTRIHSSGNGKVRDLVYQLYGREVNANLLPVNGKSESFALTGFIGKPAAARSNRNLELFFVNGRCIRSTVLTKAAEDACAGRLMQHKFPFLVLSLTMDPSLLDVNVHPAKLELRFSDNEAVYRFIYEAVTAAFLGKELVPTATPATEKETRQESRQEKAQEQKTTAETKAPEPFETNRLLDLMKETRGEKAPAAPFSTVKSGTFGKSVVKEGPSAPSAPAKKPEEHFIAPVSVETAKPSSEEKSLPFAAPVIEKETPVSVPEKKEVLPPAPKPKAEQMTLFETGVLSAEARPSYKFIGQLFDTYWLIELGTELLIMDQHAAHEKVLYERMMEHMDQNEAHPSQAMNPPAIVTLTPEEEETLQTHKSALEKAGYEIESFGGHEYAMYAAPADLPRIDVKDFLAELLDSLADRKAGASRLVSETIASMSCKAAVKGNHAMSFAEAKALTDELLTLKNPYSCPHGRPTMIRMSKYELEKKFNRVI